MAETSPAVKLMHGMTYTSLVTPGLGASAGPPDAGHDLCFWIRGSRFQRAPESRRACPQTYLSSGSARISDQ